MVLAMHSVAFLLIGQLDRITIGHHFKLHEEQTIHILLRHFCIKNESSICLDAMLNFCFRIGEKCKKKILHYSNL